MAAQARQTVRSAWHARSSPTVGYANRTAARSAVIKDAVWQPRLPSLTGRQGPYVYASASSRRPSSFAADGVRGASAQRGRFGTPHRRLAQRTATGSATLRVGSRPSLGGFRQSLATRKSGYFR